MRKFIHRILCLLGRHQPFTLTTKALIDHWGYHDGKLGFAGFVAKTTKCLWCRKPLDNHKG